MRAGTALVRYFAMIGEVLDALLEARDHDGIAILEVANTWVRDFEIDAPAIIDGYLRASHAKPLFKRDRDPVVIERRLPTTGRGDAGRVIRREVLAYRLP